MSIYVYVDGENHYIRTQDCWREIHGPLATLDHIRPDESTYVPNHVLITKSAKRLTLDEKGKVFWDKWILGLGNFRLDLLLDTLIARAYYFTSFAGDPNDLHALRRLLRSAGFEPVVVEEKSTLANQRANVLAQQRIIERAKGVDIALTVRLLEDAHRDLFDQCVVFTSDADFLPAIEAVRRLGKRVYVAGYANGLGRESRFEFIPDQFVDLTEVMRRWYKYSPQEG